MLSVGDGARGRHPPTPNDAGRVLEPVVSSGRFGSPERPFAAAFTTLDALLTFARVVLVEIEQRSDAWRAEVVHWSGATGTLAQYETDAPSLAEALARCVRALAG